MIAAGANTGDPYAPWYQHNFVVYDTETTGLEERDRVIEVGFARFEQGKLVDQWGTLIYPDMEVPQEATDIHGISSADVATAPWFVETIAPAFNICRDAWPCAYNASFDRKMLQRELSMLRVDSLALPLFSEQYRWLDPLVWIRYTRDKWSGNKLTDVCERFGIDIGSAHRATDDAVATGKVLLELANRLPPVTMTELLRRQQMLHDKQQADMKAWFRKKGIPWRD